MECGKEEGLMLNPETKETEWRHPTAWQVYLHDREMYEIILEDGTELLVSPEHRVHGKLVDNKMCLSRLGGHSAPKTFFGPQALIQNGLSRSGHDTINIWGENYLNYFNPSNLANSLVLECYKKDVSYRA